MKKFFIIALNSLILLILTDVIFYFVPRVYSEHYFYRPALLPKKQRIELKAQSLTGIEVSKYRSQRPFLRPNHAQLDFSQSGHAEFQTLTTPSGISYSIPKPESTHRSSVKTISGKIVYDIAYQYDERGRRKTEPPISDADNFIAVVGCSFAFGQGIEASTSLPGWLKQHFPDSNIYNLGRPGTSIAQHLYDLEVIEDHPKFKDLDGKNAHFVYLLPGAHMFRFTGSIHQYVESPKWAKTQPHFDWKEDHKSVEYKGTFAESQPINTKLKSLASHSNIFRKTGFSWPLLTDNHYRLYAKTVKKFETQLKKKFSLKSFTVVIGFKPRPRGITQRLIPHLQAEGLQLFDYSHIPFEKILGSNMSIPLEGHPSGRAYEFLAELIARDLKKVDSSIH